MQKCNSTKISITKHPNHLPPPHLLPPNLLSTILAPCSCHSCLLIQKLSLSFMMSANTAPPRKTMCFRRGGSSTLSWNFCGCASGG